MEQPTPLIARLKVTTRPGTALYELFDQSSDFTGFAVTLRSMISSGTQPAGRVPSHERDFTSAPDVR
jgi:hypothetical protein